MIKPYYCTPSIYINLPTKNCAFTVGQEDKQFKDETKNEQGKNIRAAGILICNHIDLYYY